MSWRRSAEKDIQPEVIEHKTPEGFDLKLQAGTIKKMKKLDRFKAEGVDTVQWSQSVLQVRGRGEWFLLHGL